MQATQCHFASYTALTSVLKNVKYLHFVSHCQMNCEKMSEKLMVIVQWNQKIWLCEESFTN